MTFLTKAEQSKLDKLCQDIFVLQTKELKRYYTRTADGKMIIADHLRYEQVEEEIKEIAHQITVLERRALNRKIYPWSNRNVSGEHGKPRPVLVEEDGRKYKWLPENPLADITKVIKVYIDKYANITSY